ncbi:hypothetical protein [Absidia glauca]|uniref:Prefoldin subunit 1 n=1 Tax=Absidia glauca TaxID=4829 RepID=A0A168Q2R6_ABSGL|nr:hypothetical protein [Absidia glauca]
MTEEVTISSVAVYSSCQRWYHVKADGKEKEMEKERRRKEKAEGKLAGFKNGISLHFFPDISCDGHRDQAKGIVHFNGATAMESTTGEHWASRRRRHRLRYRRRHRCSRSGVKRKRNDAKGKKLIFIELQAKYISSQQQVNTVKAQIQNKQRERKMAELTRRELDTLESDTKTYKPVGKMFLQSPLSDMKKEYTKGVEKANDQIQQLEKSQKYWERAAAEAQGNLKDILNGPRSM